MRKSFTHIIQVPPNTDVEQLGGAYKSLLAAVGVDSSVIPFPGNEQGFTHPIPECNQILTRDYMITMQLLQTSVLEHGAVKLDNLTLNGVTAIFVFSYPE